MSDRRHMDPEFLDPVPRPEKVDPYQTPLFDAEFDGADYQDERDRPRLTGQIERVFNRVKDGKWHTVEAIAKATGDPQTSVSAQLRNLRKAKFGGYNVEREHIEDGLYWYRLTDAKG